MDNLINFKYFSSKAAFDRELAAQTISEYTLCFIPEVNLIYTRNAYWYCPYSKEQIEELITSKGDEILNELTPLKEAIGTNTYEGTNYISKETNLTDAVKQLDEEIKATNDNLALGHEYAEATYATKQELQSLQTTITEQNNKIQELETRIEELYNALSLK